MAAFAQPLAASKLAYFLAQPTLQNVPASQMSVGNGAGGLGAGAGAGGLGAGAGAGAGGLGAGAGAGAGSSLKNGSLSNGSFGKSGNFGSQRLWAHHFIIVCRTWLRVDSC